MEAGSGCYNFLWSFIYHLLHLPVGETRLRKGNLFVTWEAKAEERLRLMRRLTNIQYFWITSATIPLIRTHMSQYHHVHIYTRTFLHILILCLSVCLSLSLSISLSIYLSFSASLFVHAVTLTKLTTKKQEYPKQRVTLGHVSEILTDFSDRESMILIALWWGWCLATTNCHRHLFEASRPHFTGSFFCSHTTSRKTRYITEASNNCCHIMTNLVTMAV